MVNVNDKVLLKLIWLAGRRRCLISPVQQRVKWKWLHGPEQEMSIPEMSICSWAEPAGLQGPGGFCQEDHGGRKMREKGVARWRPFIQRPEWINENWLKMADQRRLLEQCPPPPVWYCGVFALVWPILQRPFELFAPASVSRTAVFVPRFPWDPGVRRCWDLSFRKG